MLNPIIDELNEVLDYLWEDDCAYAYHAGRAGGIALATGARGLGHEAMWADISYAYEWLNLDAGYDENFDDFDPDHFEDILEYIRHGETNFWYVIVTLQERQEELSKCDEPGAVRIGWEEYWVALNEAIEANASGDGLRHSLMIGVASGLMIGNPGSQYSEESILGAIEEGYQESRMERLHWAQARLAAAHRLSDPSPFMGDEQYVEHMEKKLQMMRWVQNFGLYEARSEDGKVAMPYSMRINHALRQQK